MEEEEEEEEGEGEEAEKSFFSLDDRNERAKRR